MASFKKKIRQNAHCEVSSLGLEFQVSSFGLGIFDGVSVSKVYPSHGLSNDMQRATCHWYWSRGLQSRLPHYIELQSNSHIISAFLLPGYLEVNNWLKRVSL